MEKSIRRLLNRAHPHLPILVMYNIPNRDIGQYSKGGAKDMERYMDYVERFAKGVGEDSPIVIYEPDALPHSTHLPKEEQEWRLELMKKSLEYLLANHTPHTPASLHSSCLCTQHMCTSRRPNRRPFWLVLHQ